jgi:hypothetical protein
MKNSGDSCCGREGKRKSEKRFGFLICAMTDVIADGLIA